MKTKEEIQVDYDSPEAARYVEDIKGWMSRGGYFFGDDEDAARYNGCTHRACMDCGNPAPKAYIACDDCLAIRRRKRYEAMPKKEWDRAVPIYSHTSDEYYWDVEDVWLKEGESLDDKQLVICEPQQLRYVEPDYWEDQYPEDAGSEVLPQEVYEAMEALNKAIEQSPPISYMPGKFALDLSKID